MNKTALFSLKVMVLAASLSMPALHAEGASSMLGKVSSRMSSGISGTWKDVTGKLSDFRTNGWNTWSNTQKAGVIVGAGLLAVVAYQLYKSFATSKKTHKKARVA